MSFNDGGGDIFLFLYQLFLNNIIFLTTVSHTGLLLSYSHFFSWLSRLWGITFITVTKRYFVVVFLPTGISGDIVTNMFRVGL